MSLEGLLSIIEREGREEARRVVAAAREEAGRLERDAVERLERRREASTSAHAAELRARAAAEVAAVRREVRAEVLHARQALLERAFAAALSPELEETAVEAVRPGLPDALARALACVDPAGASVACAPALLEPARRALAGPSDSTSAGRAADAPPGAELRADPELRAGLRVVSADGRVQVDLTLPGRLERGRPRLAMAALRALDGAPGESA